MRKLELPALGVYFSQTSFTLSYHWILSWLVTRAMGEARSLPRASVSETSLAISISDISTRGHVVEIVKIMTVKVSDWVWEILGIMGWEATLILAFGKLAFWCRNK